MMLLRELRDGGFPYPGLSFSSVSRIARHLNISHSRKFSKTLLSLPQKPRLMGA